MCRPCRIFYYLASDFQCHTNYHTAGVCPRHHFLGEIHWPASIHWVSLVPQPLHYIVGLGLYPFTNHAIPSDAFSRRAMLQVAARLPEPSCNWKVPNKLTDPAVQRAARHPIAGLGWELAITAPRAVMRSWWNRSPCLSLTAPRFFGDLSRWLNKNGL